MKHQVVLLLLLWLSAGENGILMSMLSTQENIPTVSYCELIGNPKLYDQKEVRIKAAYREGYEWSEIYCPDCFKIEHRTWVEFSDDYKSCTKPKIVKMLDGSDKTFGIVVVGKFYGSGDRHGHMNAYRFKFVVKCVEEAKVLLKDGRSPNLVSPEILKPVCGSPSL